LSGRSARGGKPPKKQPRPRPKNNKPKTGRKGSGGGRKSAKKTGGPNAGSKRRNDPSDTDETEVRFIQPYDAVKEYLCPGCNQIIPPGMGHMVAIPPEDPDLRRHWHRGCWNNRRNRR
jgi:hypothetical protein